MDPLHRRLLNMAAIKREVAPKQLSQGALKLMDRCLRQILERCVADSDAQGDRHRIDAVTMRRCLP